MIKRTFMIGIVVCIAAILSIGTITAYLADADSARNVIRVGGNNITIDEEYDPKPIVPGTVITKKVKIRNDGPNPCYVRLRAVFSDSDIGKYAEVDWNTTDWAYDSSDEYYYYKYNLNKDEETAYLLTTIRINEDLPKEHIKNVDMIIYAESYQSYGFSDYQKAWAEYQKNNK